jgi:solute:Na+ symporter, SSS family
VDPALSLPPPATLGWLDWTVIAAYLVGAVAIGLLGARRASGSTQNFFLSGRSLPWWLVGTSLVSSAFASDTPLFVTALTRSGGVAGNWRWWGYLVGTLLVVVLFARLWRRSGVFNDIEFMELRYSGMPAAGLRAFKAVYQVACVHCIAMGWIFVGMQKLLGVVLGLGTAPVCTVAGLAITPSWLALAACAGLMFVYCEVSGLWGVVLADLLQFPVAMAGAITLAVFVVAHFGGLHSLAQHVAAVDPGKLSGLPAGIGGLAGSPAHWSPPLWDFMVMLGLLWCANKNADGGGVVIQRILAAKDERHSMLGTLAYAIVNFALRPWAWILVALATLVLVPSVTVRAPVAGRVVEASSDHVLLQPRDGGAPLTLAVPATQVAEWQPSLKTEAGRDVEAGSLLASTDDELAYQVFMRRFLPAGLFGLMVASFLAAFMSATSSHVNIAGSYLVHDVYRRFLRPDEPEAHYVRAARVVTPVVVLAALGIALVSESVTGLFNLFTSLFGGVGLAYVLRWCWWRVNAWSEVAVLASSAAMTLLVKRTPELFTPLLPPGLLDGAVPTFTGGLLLVFAASLIVVVPVTLLTRPVDPEHLAAFVAKVRPPGFWGPVRKPADWMPAGAGWWLRLLVCWAGAVVACIGLIFLQSALFLREGEGAWLWAAVTAAGLAAFGLTLRGSGHRLRAS